MRRSSHVSGTAWRIKLTAVTDLVCCAGLLAVMATTPPFAVAAAWMLLKRY
jgi:hypothetical protein